MVTHLAATDEHSRSVVDHCFKYRKFYHWIIFRSTMWTHWLIQVTDKISNLIIVCCIFMLSFGKHIPWQIKHFRASFIGPINCEDHIVSFSAIDCGNTIVSSIFVLGFFSSFFIAFSNSSRWVLIVAPNCYWKVFVLTAYIFRAFDFQKMNSK